MNVVATRFISIVKNVGQSTLALGGFLDGLFAKFNNFNILVLVVVVVIVVVVVLVIVVVLVVVFIDLLARDAVVGNNRFLGERKGVSIVKGFPDTRLGLLGTSLIVKGGKVDFESIRADWSNVVLLVHVNTIVLVIVVVVVVSIVVIVVVFSFQLFEYRKKLSNTDVIG